jgi:chromosome partitioning protein
MLNIFKSNSKQNLNKSDKSSTGKVIALMNQKGGVGKTTMAYNMAHALKANGNKVLCIDMDPQFNFSLLFGYDPKLIEKNVFHLLVNSVKELKPLHTDLFLSEVIIRNEQGIDIIPAGQELSGFELTVAGINSPRQLILKKFIDKYELRSMYDYIVIDGPPTLGLLVVNILCTCDGVLFPFIPDAFSKQGLTNIHNVIEDIEDMGIVTPPKVLGYIPNLFEQRRKKSKEDFLDIKEQFNGATIFTPFTNKASFAKSMANKKSVFEYQAADYVELQSMFLTVADSVENQLQTI